MEAFIKFGAAAGILALLVCAILAFKSPSTIVTTPSPSYTDTSNTNTANSGADQVGAASGNRVDTNCLVVNGVKSCHARVSMMPATSTPCAINIGQFGSSTLIRATISQDLASTSIVTIGRGNTQYATTTFIDEVSVTANTQPVIVVVATSTPGTAATAAKYTFGPGAGSKYLVFGVAAGATTLTGPTGVCEASWTVLR